jgi:pimeloyl-ACP methyl ester carboxylesterase
MPEIMLNFTEYGVSDGIPFFYFHGTPGSSRECAFLHASAVRLRMRVIGVDRPGYGDNPVQANHSLQDWPRHIEIIADQLGLARFGVIGISGGGPYALACASMLAHRLSKVCVVCGLAPFYSPDLRNNMSWFLRHVFSAVDDNRWWLLNIYGQFLMMLAKNAPRLFLGLLSRYLGGEDREVLKDSSVLQILSENLRRAFAQGKQGLINDLVVYCVNWGFDLSRITLPVQLWHGACDKVVPLAHSEFLHATMAGSSLHIIPDAGHFSLPIKFVEYILGELVI